MRKCRRALLLFQLAPQRGGNPQGAIFGELMRIGEVGGHLVWFIEETRCAEGYDFVIFLSTLQKQEQKLPFFFGQGRVHGPSGYATRKNSGTLRLGSNNMRFLIVSFILAFWPGAAHASSFLEIQERLDLLTEGENHYRAVGAAVVDRQDVRFFQSGIDAISPDSLVEIGSNTKIFSSLLLALAHVKGLTSLDGDINSAFGEQILPDEINRTLTLSDLSTHASGLPRLPDNLPSEDPSQPYIGFGLAELKAFMASLEWRKSEPESCASAEQSNPQDYSDIFGHEVRRKRSCYNYSNVGVSILGHAAARTLSSTYERAVHDFISQPLSLIDTTFQLSESQSSRKVLGYDDKDHPVAGWRHGVGASPAGALYSTLADMSRFMVFFLKSLASPNSDLARAAQLTTTETRVLSAGSQEITLGLGWHVTTSKSGRKIFWHNGGTAGFRSFMAIDPVAERAVFVVSNTYLADSRIDATGFDILDR